MCSRLLSSLQAVTACSRFAGRCHLPSGLLATPASVHTLAVHCTCAMHVYTCDTRLAMSQAMGCAVIQKQDTAGVCRVQH